MFPVSAHGFRIGQRVSITLPVAGPDSGLSIPASSIIHDIHGGEWVYVRVGTNAYERRRVEVAAVSGGRAAVSRGLTAGTPVVTAGAAELFGTEFGAK